MLIPEILTKNITAIYGQAGKAWLDNLPNLLLKYENLWQIKLGECLHDVNFNYVATALLNNQENVVMKCGFPGKNFNRELSALKHFDGDGAVKVLQSNIDDSIMLLERIEPGSILETFNEEESVFIAIELMHKLHKPIPENKIFPTLLDWFEGFNRLNRRFNGGTGLFPKELIDRAKSISNLLLDSIKNPILLHGDLHYANILYSDDRGWLAIDPHGVIGEAEYEIPMPRINESINKKIIQKRFDRFIDISGFDRQRIMGWGLSKTTLAAWWTFEDSGEIYLPFLHCAELISEIWNG